MFVEMNKIHLDGKQRLRRDYGDINELAARMAKYGQLQDILVRRPDPGETLEEGKEFVLVDGARRFLAIGILHSKHFKIVDGVGGVMPVGTIGTKFRGEEDSLYSLELEYHANADRKDFDWKEKLGYIRRIHEGHKGRDSNWTLEKSAELLEASAMTISRYLDFLSEPEAFQSERVQTADSYRTARKQFEIERENLRRKRAVHLREKSSKVEAATRGFDPTDFVSEIIQLGDCREWIKQFDAQVFDWVHWDPPYGGEQAGGAHAAHTRIDDTWELAEPLMREMLRELYRTMRKGAWMALWFHPARYAEVVDLLEGAGFWVNPYPNIWFKSDRVAAGHEIKRFLVNAYETFFFACKSDDPILPKHDRQNVFVHRSPSREERRHSMHKPAPLIADILDILSIRGERGCDPSSGSGSSAEAALGSGRRIVCCELIEEFRNSSIEAVVKVVEEKRIRPFDPMATGDEIKTEEEEVLVDMLKEYEINLEDL